jgi:hypothetical protein
MHFLCSLFGHRYETIYHLNDDGEGPHYDEEVVCTRCGDRPKFYGQ